MYLLQSSFITEHMHLNTANLLRQVLRSITPIQCTVSDHFFPKTIVLLIWQPPLFWFQSLKQMLGLAAVIFFHSDTRALVRWHWLLGGKPRSQHSRSLQRTVSGFRSGPCVGQSSSSTPNWENIFKWTCWNRKGQRVLKAPFTLPFSTPDCCVQKCSRAR